MAKRGGTIRGVARLRELLMRWRGKTPSEPPDVPPGHVAVIVGRERRRFVVRASHLSHPAFQRLLSEAAEEFGFGHVDGPVLIPCDEAVFLETLRRVTAARSGFTSPVRFTRLGKCEPDSRTEEAAQMLLLGFGVS